MWLEGSGLIVMGITYLIKPDLFLRLLWPQIPVAARVLTPEQNQRYMRTLGGACIVWGLILSALPAGTIAL